jgi:hypothetical protein
MTRLPSASYEIEEELVLACHRTVCEMRDTWGKAIHGERLNQRRADKAGSDKGSPDYLLVLNGWNHPLEFKKSKGGRFSLDQIMAAERRRAAGVETYAPKRLLDFDALVAWSERHRDGVCPGCPVVPPYEAK